MKNFFSITILVMSITFLCSCNQANKKNVQVAEGTEACCEKSTKSCCDSTAIVQSEVTTVVYFHNERRCATCLAVEEVAQDDEE